jgi:hypothetical protein
MMMAFVPPLPPPPQAGGPGGKPDAATLIILVIAAVLMLPFGWAHQTRSKWPPSARAPIPIEDRNTVGPSSTTAAAPPMSR